MEGEMMGGVTTALEIPQGNPTRTGPNDTSVSPSWKLYDNPFFYNYHPHHHQHHLDNSRQNHTHLPISARKLAASFCRDLNTLFQERSMEELYLNNDAIDGTVATEQLCLARARIKELKAEVEFERRLRRKAESRNKALARELSEERACREARERAYEEVAEEMGRLRREVEEERQMMRVSEVLREERVQMKFLEAKLLMEERLLQMSSSSYSSSSSSFGQSNKSEFSNKTSMTSCSVQRSSQGSSNVGSVENPHIRRGIKGFVEFPKGTVLRGGARANNNSFSSYSTSSSSCSTAGNWMIRSEGRLGGGGGSLDPPKLECQMAQLRILLLKQQRNNIQVGLGSSSSGTEGNLVV